MARTSSDDFWNFLLRLTRPALIVAPTSFVHEARDHLHRWGVSEAVARRDSGRIYELLIALAQYQGISDRAADTFINQHGLPSWSKVDAALKQQPSCSLLRSYWTYSGCQYTKGAEWCSRSENLLSCPVPALPLRKGTLSQLAVSLFLFVRDVCDRDLVGWLDKRLAEADDPQAFVRDRVRTLRNAILEPISHVHGISGKVASLALANLLLAGDPGRERWVMAGAGMLVVDTLLHNYLHRTGVLRRADAEHPYGPQCYAERGCSFLLEGLAERIDARESNSCFPQYFPRFVQHAVWRFCAQAELDVCNGNRIDDRTGCTNTHCPSIGCCERLPLRGYDRGRLR